MKIVTIEPLSLTVDLDLTDALAIVHALAKTADHNADTQLNRALSAGLLATAYAAFLLAEEDLPHTVEKMWQRWAPEQEALVTPTPVVYPDALPITDDRMHRYARERAR